MFRGEHFHTANAAFITVFAELCFDGIETGNGTKKLHNVGFYITNPLKRDISAEWRNWSKTYAEREWEWYLSKNRSVEELKKFAPIWDRMHNGDNIVNSNYGYLWSEKGQLEKTIEQLRKDPLTRRAWITIFDGKNKDEFEKDTPCTLSIGFTIENNKLCMSVFMRSNDIWFGFCNDQYCFSKLQEHVASELDLPVGWYYHHAADMHVYERHYYADKKFYLQNDASYGR